MKICFSLTWRHGKKCKKCLYESQKNNCPQKLPTRFIFQYRCSKVVFKFFKNTFDGVQVLEELYIVHHILLKNSFLWNTFWKLTLLLCFKKLEKILGTSRIMIPIPNSSLSETGTGRLIFWRNKQKGEFWFNTLQSRKKYE